MITFDSIFGNTVTNDNIVKEAFEIEGNVAETNNVQDNNELYNNEGDYICEKTNVFDFININQSFGDFHLFKDFSLSIPDFRGQGQFISFMGQSGCGKSSLLKIIAGLAKPDSGKVLFYGKELTEKNKFPMVFQQYSSFDWMTVVENVELPLKMKGVGKKERREKALNMLKIVGLKEQSDKWAKMPPLSGGQLQRVALARSLAAGSNIILLDESTGALDIKSKREMQDTLLDIYYSSEIDPTFLNVSHDISECVYLSNRIYILTANPCNVHTVIDIDFGTERRTQEIRQTEKFNDYVRKIEQIMNEINK